MNRSQRATGVIEELGIYLAKTDGAKVFKVFPLLLPAPVSTSSGGYLGQVEASPPLLAVRGGSSSLTASLFMSLGKKGSDLMLTVRSHLPFPLPRLPYSTLVSGSVVWLFPP